MLFILGLLFAKLTGAMMTMSISQRNYYKVIQGFQVVCGLWALSSIFVVAFECGVPKPWNIFSNTCIRRVRTEHRARSANNRRQPVTPRSAPFHPPKRPP